jgi:hypothetical protein
MVDVVWDLLHLMSLNRHSQAHSVLWAAAAVILHIFCFNRPSATVCLFSLLVSGSGSVVMGGGTLDPAAEAMDIDTDPALDDGGKSQFIHSFQVSYIVDIASSEFFEMLGHTQELVEYLEAAKGVCMSQESIRRLIDAMRALNIKSHSIVEENGFTDIQKHQDIEWPFPHDNEALSAGGTIEASLKLLKWCVDADLTEESDMADAVSLNSLPNLRKSHISC